MQLFLQSIYNTRLHKIDQVADVSPLSCRFMALNTARTPYDRLLSILACLDWQAARFKPGATTTSRHRV